MIIESRGKDGALVGRVGLDAADEVLFTTSELNVRFPLIPWGSGSVPPWDPDPAEPIAFADVARQIYMHGYRRAHADISGNMKSATAIVKDELNGGRI